MKTSGRPGRGGASVMSVLHRARAIGPYTAAVVEALYSTTPLGPAHRAAQRLVELSRRYPAIHVEVAAEQAVETRRPTITLITRLVQRGDFLFWQGSAQLVLPLVDPATLFPAPTRAPPRRERPAPKEPEEKGLPH